MGSCIDLRKYENSDAIQDAFSKIVSGKMGYKAVIERKHEPLKCPSCAKLLEGNEKFCPECGAKVNLKK
jgi:rRNA maturation endonuclease Nob1